MKLKDMLHRGDLVSIDMNILVDGRPEQILGRIKSVSDNLVVINPALSLSQLADRVGYFRTYYFFKEKLQWLREQRVGSIVDGEIPRENIKKIMVYAFGTSDNYTSQLILDR